MDDLLNALQTFVNGLLCIVDLAAECVDGVRDFVLASVKNAADGFRFTAAVGQE